MGARATIVRNLANNIEQAVADEDWSAALANMGKMGDAFSDLAADVAQEAYNEGMTKKAIAERLNVPPSTFRGMVKA